MMEKKIGKFGLIIHPLNMDLYKKYINLLKPNRIYNDQLILKLFEWAPSYKINEWINYSLNDGRYVDGTMLICPFFPEMKDIDLMKILKKVEEAIKLAKDNNCTAVALGAFTSIVIQGKEEEYSLKYDIKITSGNSLTSVLINKSILELSELFEKNLKKSTLTIIGASGDIGSGCMIYFGDKVKKMTITARSLPRLQKSVEKNKSHIKCELELTTDNRKAIKNSDIVVLVSSSPTQLLDIDDFDPKTIVCDASAPLNVGFNKGIRKDVFLYHGGIARLPNPLDVGLDIGLPKLNTLYGCLTEGILHSLYENLPVSHGRGNITLERMNVFFDLIEKKVPIKAAYPIGNREYTQDEIYEYSINFTNDIRNKIYSFGT